MIPNVPNRVIQSSREPTGASTGATLPPSISPSQSPTIPDHELLRRIGGGSYGEVWLARNVVGTLRAVKIVSRGNFSEAYPFEREFKGIQKYEPVSRTHDGLVDILQIGRNDEAGYFYYVMELADDANAECGVRSAECAESITPAPSSIRHSAFRTPHSYMPRTLRSDLKARGRLPLDDCIQVGLSMSSALEHLHHNGLVHRDIKPSNVIFVNGVPKLADIGLVADVDEARSFVGTVGFIAPEGPGSAQADVYSLGKVLYEMLTGKDRQDFPALPEEFQTTDNSQLKGVNQVILGACEGDRRLRYPSAQAMHDDLSRVAEGRAVRVQRSRRATFAVVARISLAILVLASVIFALVVSRTRTQRHIPNPEAVRLYDLGRWYYQQLTDESLKKAIKYLSQAIQVDPEFVPPYTTLVGMYTWKVPGMSEEETHQRIKEIAARLLHLDPRLAEGHIAAAYSKYLEGDWHMAQKEMQEALRLNPNYAQAHTIACYFLSLLGQVEEAKVHGERAQQLDPTSRIAATIAGYPFIAARQYDQAIGQFRKALELETNFPLAHQWIGTALEAKGDYLGALEEFEKSAVFSGMDQTDARQRFDTIRQGYVASGARGYWLRVLEIRLEAEALQEQPKVGELDQWPLDGIYAQLGETNKAIELLERDFLGGDPSWLRLEPLYEPLRNEPRFKALLKPAGLER
ncbi:MAG TPA: serine/threonine-protein kinase [Candidatus Limnocylindrales bacterium]|nr:serine/threonine-protein kinase [Candidatus Limnocylindrales bacterium]